MLTTVLFDMGGTLEDIWYNEDTQRATCRRLLEVLRANGLEPGLYFEPLPPELTEFPTACAGSGTSSSRVFHAPQDGHFPFHLALS